MNLADEMRQLVSDYASSWSVDDIYNGCIEKIKKEAKEGHNHCYVWVNAFNPYDCCDESEKWHAWLDKMPNKVMDDVTNKLIIDGFLVINKKHELEISW